MSAAFPQSETTELAAQILKLLRVTGSATTTQIAAARGVPIGRVRYALLWLEAEHDVARAGHSGSATVWTIPTARR